MTIPLPPLPETRLTLPYPDDDETVYTVFQVRQIQREAMRVALEAAAVLVLGNKHRNATDLELCHAIRALEIAP